MVCETIMETRVRGSASAAGVGNYKSLAEFRNAKSYGCDEVGKMFGPSKGGDICNLWKDVKS